MKIALSAKNKLGFVNGLIQKPNNSPAQLLAWQRYNEMVTSWILNVLSKEIGDSVLYANSVAEIWNELDERFGQSNGVRLYQLQKDLCSISQGNSNIAAYYTRMKKVWDELSMVTSLPRCNCGVAQEILKYEQDQRLIQFLMGLNSDYNTVRGNILLIKPLPSISAAYGMLVQEEKQKEIQIPSPFTSEHTSLNANIQLHNKGRYEDKKVPICNHCKKKGHTANKCYRIIGFPKDFKFTKGKGVAAHVSSEGMSDTNDHEDRPAVSFSNELCNQFMQFLNTYHGEKSRSDSSSEAFTAHMIGPFQEEASGSW
ncbi:unnamed protein product [Cuscuta campestris]|uniref:Retrotransposon gag domain-containing protein n=1 Tax=Cuscuta campestris TaxID=132261 RepID=A0A484KKS8_9ASTE|nr:unnamed protein product [Cuscuta campestris]